MRSGSRPWSEERHGGSAGRAQTEKGQWVAGAFGVLGGNHRSGSGGGGDPAGSLVCSKLVPKLLAQRAPHTL